MKTVRFATVALAATLLTTSAALAASGSVTGTASAVVVGPVTIVQTTPLSFGTFGIGSTASRISSAGTSDSGITVMTPGHDAVFTVTGQNTSYTLDQVTTVTLSDGAGHSMTTEPLNYLYGVRQLTGGQDTVNVTAILDVPGNQPSGTYNGSYTMSVHY